MCKESVVLVGYVQQADAACGGCMAVGCVQKGRCATRLSTLLKRGTVGGAQWRRCLGLAHQRVAMQWQPAILRLLGLLLQWGASVVGFSNCRGQQLVECAAGIDYSYLGAVQVWLHGGDTVEVWPACKQMFVGGAASRSGLRASWTARGKMLNMRLAEMSMVGGTAEGFWCRRWRLVLELAAGWWWPTMRVGSLGKRSSFSNKGQ